MDNLPHYFIFHHFFLIKTSKKYSFSLFFVFMHSDLHGKIVTEPGFGFCLVTMAPDCACFTGGAETGIMQKGEYSYIKPAPKHYNRKEQNT